MTVLGFLRAKIQEVNAAESVLCRYLKDREDLAQQ
jgi:hypothetical protein